MALDDKQRGELNTDMPPEFVMERSGYDGKTLSFIEGWRVIDEMNRIVGAGRWGYRCTVTKAWEGRNAKQNYAVTYLGSCVLTVGDCVIEDVGVGQGVARFPADAIEKAAKEAATDSLKRCLKSLGRRMGLALYDKQQRHVGNAGGEDGDGKERSRGNRNGGGRQRGGERDDASMDQERQGEGIPREELGALLALVKGAQTKEERQKATATAKELWSQMSGADRRAYNDALELAKAAAKSNAR